MSSLTSPVTELPASRFIPLDVPEVLDLAVAGLDDDNAARLRTITELADALLHTRYRSRWQQVRTLQTGDGEFVDHLRQVLDAANYDEVDDETLQKALAEASVFKVALHVELDWFDELLLFRRGSQVRTEQVDKWKGLRHEQVEFTDYSRVAMYARYQSEQWFREHDVDLEDLPFTPGGAHAKLFQQVPAADLEMLIPGTDVRMRTLDKLFFGVPAVVGGVVIAVTKLAAALGLLLALSLAAVGTRDTPSNLDAGAFITLLGGLVAFASYLWRQWTKFKNRRLAFMKRLSENLYGKTLADGTGVLFTVLDAGEEEDLKETVLAYRLLLDGDCPADELDDRVESLLAEPCDGSVDFEVADGTRKLALLGLATESDGVWHAVPTTEAVDVLRERWREIGDDLASSD